MITVLDIAYVRLQAPDLDLMQGFLVDFGMQVVERTDRALYMRGRGSLPFIHVTEWGPQPRHAGFGLLAQSEADLHKIAAEFATEVLENLEPGGGKIVSIRDPQGLRIDILHGQASPSPLPVRAPLKYNPGQNRTRFGQTQRVAPAPSQVMRLGHVALYVTDFSASLDFYTRHFGMRTVDRYYAEQPGNVIAAFLRCGIGKSFTDHHTVALISKPRADIDHMGFEVLDWDDVMVGNAYLKNKGYKHSWGVGRHIEGSQIFDYWRDPFGNKIEHWTDGDLINDDYVGGLQPLSPAALSQWGPPITEDFFS